jgi:hypothetical protein
MDPVVVGEKETPKVQLLRGFSTVVGMHWLVPNATVVYCPLATKLYKLTATGL